MNLSEMKQESSLFTLQKIELTDISRLLMLDREVDPRKLLDEECVQSHQKSHMQSFLCGYCFCLVE